MNAKNVTLTFDNGPTAGVTGAVLDILKARRILATFFLVGERLERAGGLELAARARAEGHWIGNHSYSHSAPLGERPDPEYARHEIEDTQALIGELSHGDKLFRPMGGGGVIGPHLFSRSAFERLQAGKFTCVLWSSVPGDWKDQEGWVERCLSDLAVQDWSVVVLHDVENGALPRLSEFLDRAGSLGVSFRQEFPPDAVILRRGEICSPRTHQLVR